MRVLDTGLTGVLAASRAVILVEGMSDAYALRTIAARLGRDLSTEGVAVVAMGGATNIGHFLEHLGPHGLRLQLAGLCDAAEERHFRRGLERAGLGRGLSRAEMESLGFYACTEDLEDELIRALGMAAVEQTITENGELQSLRILQNQPAQRDRSPQQQLRRFMGSRSGRKARYARLLAETVDLARLPRPLERVLGHL